MLLRILVILVAGFAAIILISSIDSDNKDADYLVVLGYPLFADMPRPDLAMRLDKAYRYLQKYPNAKLVLSGGKSKNSTVTESYAMKEYLDARGMDTSTVIMENYASNTIENIVNSLDLIDRSKRVVFLSSSYHIFRIKLILVMMRIDAGTLACPAPFSSLLANLLKEEYKIIRTFMEFKKR